MNQAVSEFFEVEIMHTMPAILATHRCCFWPHLLISVPAGRVAISSELHWEVQHRDAALSGPTCRHGWHKAAEG